MKHTTGVGNTDRAIDSDDHVSVLEVFVLAGKETHRSYAGTQGRCWRLCEGQEDRGVVEDDF